MNGTKLNEVYHKDSRSGRMIKHILKYTQPRHTTPHKVTHKTTHRCTTLHHSSLRQPRGTNQKTTHHRTTLATTQHSAGSHIVHSKLYKEGTALLTSYHTMHTATPNPLNNAFFGLFPIVVDYSYIIGSSFNVCVLFIQTQLPHIPLNAFPISCSWSSAIRLTHPCHFSQGYLHPSVKNNTVPPPHNSK